MSVATLAEIDRDATEVASFLHEGWRCIGEKLVVGQPAQFQLAEDYNDVKAALDRLVTLAKAAGVVR